MMRTIPSMCLVCGEIADVAVPLGETGPGSCPMCGGELTCDFDLPVNEHVRVEVQTPERLRLCYPCVIPAPGLFQKIAWFQFSLSPIVIIWMMVQSCSQRPSIFGFVLCLGVVAYFVMCSVICLYIGLLIAFGRTTLDFDRKCLDIKMRLWGYCRTRTVKLNKIQSIYSFRSICTVQEMNHDSRNRMILWGRKKTYRYLSIKGGTDFDSARYVTHLIRRQLITMGHELQDG
ncbi:hypothetical protein [Symmachiella dynata]|uniref:hypothetical protein n=1 Tax=Symmachiella dynata TaxID=2527995 RepID=UPI0011A2A856|nr:hypothetical protein [Symmachiella dynata]